VATEIEKRVEELKKMGARLTAVKKIEDMSISILLAALRELETMAMVTTLRLPELENAIKGIQRRLKYIEDEIAYLEKVMAKNKLFDVMVQHESSEEHEEE